MTTAGQRPRILFIDDEAALLEGLRRALESLDLDWETTFETSPIAALERALHCHFDVIVCDLGMPDLDGLSLLTRLKKAGVQSQTIILTGTGDMTSAIDAINRVGVFRYYTKPCRAERLAEGIAEALTAARSHDGTASLAAAALDALPFATFAVDAGNRLLFVNRSGAELLAAGVVVSIDGTGALRAASQADTVTLHRAIADVAAGAKPSVMALKARDDRLFSALVEPPAPARPGAAAILFIRDRDAADVPGPDALRQLFGLTPTEARLAHALVSGLDVREAAQSLGVTVSTARTYLRYIFQKTGVNRQSELTRVLVGSVVMA